MKIIKRKLVFLGLIFPIFAIACGVLTPSGPTPIPAVATIAAPTPVVVQMEIPKLTSNEEAILVDLYANVNPAVVNIVTYGNQGRYQAPTGQGSGFVIDNLGHIVTNSHVVHGAEELEVILSDGIFY